MGSDGLAIDDEKIDVEEIMRQIKEDLARKRSEEKPSLDAHRDEGGDHVQYINSNWDIHNNSYVVSSHRPVIGKILVNGRDLIHSEVKRYIDPVISKQSQFNHSTARLFKDIIKRQDEMAARTNEIAIKLEKLEEIINGEIIKLRTDLSEDLSQVRAELRNDIENNIEEKIRSVVAAIGSEIDSQAWLANLLNKRIERDLNAIAPASKDEINYFVFEERFRGSREDINRRQRQFVHFFEKCHNVLDIGCGRGEFLELLQAESVSAKGIDINEDMVNYCSSKGLNVERIDAVTYLERIDDKSLDGIFLDQVVEHLEPDYLLKMLNLCYKKMIYGSYLVMETVNPLSLFSFANFYIDLTHKRPVHPETLKFILEASGLRDVKTQFISPVSDGMRLKRMIVAEDSEKNNALTEIYNYNIDKLNNILYGPQDYLAFGKK